MHGKTRLHQGVLAETTIRKEVITESSDTKCNAHTTEMRNFFHMCA